MNGSVSALKKRIIQGQIRLFAVQPIDNRFRVGPRALDLIIREAGDEKPSADHLEAAILKLQAIDPSEVGILKTMNESIVRLSSMILAHVLTDDGDVNEAMTELYQAITRDIQGAAKDTRSEDEGLPKVKAFVDKQVTEITGHVFAKEDDLAERER